MTRRIDHYEISVDVERGPGIQPLVDIVADGLERIGYTENDYEVVVYGPPEMRIVVVPR